MKNQFVRRSIRITGAILLIYALLVSSHLGEFWPFSIYPMFSQAGGQWTRVLVQDLTPASGQLIWETTNIENLHGPPVALNKLGINQIDFSDFVSKTDVWNETRKNALLQKFPPDSLQQNQWMITKVQGRLTHKDSVIVDAVPFLMVSGDSVITNPTLPNHLYNSRL